MVKQPSLKNLNLYSDCQLLFPHQKNSKEIYIIKAINQNLQFNTSRDSKCIYFHYDNTFLIQTNQTSLKKLYFAAISRCAELFQKGGVIFGRRNGEQEVEFLGTKYFSNVWQNTQET